MDQILVPEHALKSESAFREWSIQTCLTLFPKNGSNYLKNYYSMDSSTIKQKFEMIAKYVSLVYSISENRVDLNPPSKKLKTVSVDIVSVTCEIIMSHFNVGCTKMGRILSKNHATIIYYRRRHRNFLGMKQYKMKYLSLLNLLYNEGIIQPITESERDSQRVLHPVLH
jgi:hypothetical protein